MAHKTTLLASFYQGVPFNPWNPSVDWNGDGLAEIVISEGGNISVWLGRTDFFGTPFAFRSIDIATDPPDFSITASNDFVRFGGLEDFDGDGVRDLFLRNLQGAIEIFAGFANELATAKPRTGIDLSAREPDVVVQHPNSEAHTCLLSDLNADSRIDILTYAGGGDWPDVFVVYGRSLADVTRPLELDPRTGDADVEFDGANWEFGTCDVDGDGSADILFDGFSNEILVYLGRDADGSLLSHNISVGAATADLVVSDVEGSFVFRDPVSGESRIQMLWHDHGDGWGGSFEPQQLAAHLDNGTVSRTDLDAIVTLWGQDVYSRKPWMLDIDGDGQLDLLTLLPTNSSWVAFFGPFVDSPVHPDLLEPDVTFLPKNFELENPDRVATRAIFAIGDINGDGAMDFSIQWGGAIGESVQSTSIVAGGAPPPSNRADSRRAMIATATSPQRD
jgi:hypothetical protein